MFRSVVHPVTSSGTVWRYGSQLAEHNLAPYLVSRVCSCSDLQLFVDDLTNDFLAIDNFEGIGIFIDTYDYMSPFM